MPRETGGVTKTSWAKGINSIKVDQPSEPLTKLHINSTRRLSTSIKRKLSLLVSRKVRPFNSKTWNSSKEAEVFPLKTAAERGGIADEKVHYNPHKKLTKRLKTNSGSGLSCQDCPEYSPTSENVTQSENRQNSQSLHLHGTFSGQLNDKPHFSICLSPVSDNKRNSPVMSPLFETPKFSLYKTDPLSLSDLPDESNTKNTLGKVLFPKENRNQLCQINSRHLQSVPNQPGYSSSTHPSLLSPGISERLVNNTIKWETMPHTDFSCGRTSSFSSVSTPDSQQVLASTSESIRTMNTKTQLSSPTVNTSGKKFSDFSISFLLGQDNHSTGSNSPCNHRGEHNSSCKYRNEQTTSGCHSGDNPTTKTPDDHKRFTTHCYNRNRMRRTLSHDNCDSNLITPTVDGTGCSCSNTPTVDGIYVSSQVTSTGDRPDNNSLNTSSFDGPYINRLNTSTADRPTTSISDLPDISYLNTLAGDATSLNTPVGDGTSIRLLNTSTHQNPGLSIQTASEHTGINIMATSAADTSGFTSLRTSTSDGPGVSSCNTSTADGSGISSLNTSTSDYYCHENVTSTLSDSLSEENNSQDGIPAQNKCSEMFENKGLSRKRHLSEEVDNSDHTDACASLSTPKMARFKYTQEQISSLTAAFATNRYPTYDDLIQLSLKNDVPVRRLQIWFQNKRASTTGTRKPKSQQMFDPQMYHNINKVQTPPEQLCLTDRKPYVDSSLPRSAGNILLHDIHNGLLASHNYSQRYLGRSPGSQLDPRLHVSANRLPGSFNGAPNNNPALAQSRQRNAYPFPYYSPNFQRTGIDRAYGDNSRVSVYGHGLRTYPQDVHSTQMFTPYLSQIGAQTMTNCLAAHYNHLLNLLNIQTSHHQVNTAPSSVFSPGLDLSKSSHLSQNPATITTTGNLEEKGHAQKLNILS